MNHIARGVRATYRELIQNLRAIPDVEIRAYYHQTYRTLAQAALIACQDAPGPSSDPSDSPVRLYSKLKKEMRAIKAVNEGSYKNYSRMMDMTYGRRGKRKWEILDTIFPLSLQRPEPPLDSPRPRRLHPPAPYPAHIVPLVSVPKESKTPPRESLKPPTTRVTVNKKWAERADQISKMNLPLAIRRQSSHSRMIKGEESVNLDRLGSEEWDTFAGGFTRKERIRLLRWSYEAERMLDSLKRLTTFAGDRGPVPIAMLSKLRPWSDGGVIEAGDTNPLRSMQRKDSRVRFSIPPRTIRRSYERFSRSLPILVASYSTDKKGLARPKPATTSSGSINESRSAIRWSKSQSTGSTSSPPVMSAHEAAWIL